MTESAAPTSTPISSNYIKRKNLDFKKMVKRLVELQDVFSGDVYTLAGFTNKQVSDNKLSNACAIRLSIAMNESGDPVGSGYGFRPQRKNLIGSVHKMSEYLEAKYGPPDIEWPVGAKANMLSKVGTKQGIVLFLGASGAPGASHATAWEANSLKTIDDAFTTGTYKVRFWVF